MDDAGLGKSITTIVAADRAGVGLLLVLAPTVVAWNWAKEVRRWSPKRDVRVVASSRDLPGSLSPGTVVIVTHGLLIRGPVFDWIGKWTWDLVVLDEAHYFRNATAQRTRAFYGTGGVVHRAKRVWLLTGTPMPNDATELWPHLRGLWPERCSLSFEAFRDKFCVTEWSQLQRDYKVIGNKAEALPELKAMLSGLFLRRLKKDTLSLPPIRWETVVLPQPDGEALLEHLDGDLQKLIAGQPPDVQLDILRQNKEFAAYRRLCGIAKVAPTLELLANDELPKVVVFAHHLDVISGLEAGIDAAHRVTITGAVSAHERTKRVVLFQADPTVRVALCQINAAGVGITLTAATEVVFVEASFVPADNSQAADRCHRIGQTGSVRVRFLSLAGTVDELVAETLARKSAMIREVFPLESPKDS